jgi:hypothetical protein
MFNYAINERKKRKLVPSGSSVYKIDFKPTDIGYDMYHNIVSLLWCSNNTLSEVSTTKLLAIIAPSEIPELQI